MSECVCLCVYVYVVCGSFSGRGIAVNGKSDNQNNLDSVSQLIPKSCSAFASMITYKMGIVEALHCVGMLGIDCVLEYMCLVPQIMI